MANTTRKIPRKRAEVLVRKLKESNRYKKITQKDFEAALKNNLTKKKRRGRGIRLDDPRFDDKIINEKMRKKYNFSDEEMRQLEMFDRAMEVVFTPMDKW